MRPGIACQSHARSFGPSGSPLPQIPRQKGGGGELRAGYRQHVLLRPNAKDWLESDSLTGINALPRSKKSRGKGDGVWPRRESHNGDVVAVTGFDASESPSALRSC